MSSAPSMRAWQGGRPAPPRMCTTQHHHHVHATLMAQPAAAASRLSTVAAASSYAPDGQQAAGRTRAPRPFGTQYGRQEGGGREVGRPGRDSDGQQQGAGGRGTRQRDSSGSGPRERSDRDTGGGGYNPDDANRPSSSSGRDAPREGGAGRGRGRDSRGSTARHSTGGRGPRREGGGTPRRSGGPDGTPELQALRGLVTRFETTPKKQTPQNITQGMRKVVTHMEGRADYTDTKGFNAEERQLMDRLTAMALSTIVDMESILDPITALYSCACGRYWQPELCPAMMGLLEANECAMLQQETSGQSFGNFGFIVKEAANAADKGKGNSVAHDIVQRAVKAGGLMQSIGSAVSSTDEQGTPKLQLKPQAIRDLLLACVALPYTANTQLLDSMLAGLAEHCRAPPSDLRGQHIAQSLYACAVMASEHSYVPNPAYLQAFAKRAADIFAASGNTVPAKELSMSVFSLAVCHQYHPGFLGVVEGAIGSSLSPRAGFDAQACSHLLWGMAMVGHVPRDAVAERLLVRLFKSRPKPRELVNSLWALAVMKLPASCHKVSADLLRTVYRVPAGGFTEAMLVQLWQVHDAAQRAGVRHLMLSGPLWEGARKAAEADMMKGFAQLSASTTQQVRTALQRIASACSADQPLQLAEGVQLLGLRGLPDATCMLRHSPWPVRQPQPDMYYIALDAVVEVTYSLPGEPQQQVQVAVEYDGPTHFCTNVPFTKRLVGATGLRNERLRHAFNGMLLTVSHRDLAASSGAQHDKLLKQLGALLLQSSAPELVSALDQEALEAPLEQHERDQLLPVLDAPLLLALAREPPMSADELATLIARRRLAEVEMLRSMHVSGPPAYGAKAVKAAQLAQWLVNNKEAYLAQQHTAAQEASA